MVDKDLMGDKAFILKKIFAEETPLPLTSKERVTLIHKGNAIFNRGDMALAEKVFRTARYQDGLIRVAEHHYREKMYFKSAEIFRVANYLKGEYLCYLKLGLVQEVGDIAKPEDRKKMDDEINKKIAAAVSKMLARP